MTADRIISARTELHRDGVDDERWTKVLWRHHLNFGVVASTVPSN